MAMLDHSSTRAELEERHSRLLYHAACLNFLLSEFRGELEAKGLLNDAEQASFATPREEMTAFLAQLDQFVRDRVSAAPRLDYIDLFTPGQQNQGIEDLKRHMAWLERLLSATQGEIRTLNDALNELNRAEMEEGKSRMES